MLLLMCAGKQAATLSVTFFLSELQLDGRCMHDEQQRPEERSFHCCLLKFFHLYFCNLMGHNETKQILQDRHRQIFILQLLICEIYAEAPTIQLNLSEYQQFLLSASLAFLLVLWELQHRNKTVRVWLQLQLRDISTEEGTAAGAWLMLLC